MWKFHSIPILRLAQPFSCLPKPYNTAALPSCPQTFRLAPLLRLPCPIEQRPDDRSQHSRTVCGVGLLHAKSTAHTATLATGSLSLHLLRHLDVDLEELGDAAVQAYRFALVQVGFTVGWRDALLRAGLDEAVEVLY